MREWLFLLGGMIAWTVHFFGIYGLASVFGTTLTARIGVGLLTVACLAADAVVARKARARLRTRGLSPEARWRAIIAAMLTVASAVAIIWQSFPALIG